MHYFVKTMIMKKYNRGPDAKPYQTS